MWLITVRWNSQRLVDLWQEYMVRWSGVDVTRVMLVSRLLSQLFLTFATFHIHLCSSCQCLSIRNHPSRRGPFRNGKVSVAAVCLPIAWPVPWNYSFISCAGYDRTAESNLSTEFRDVWTSGLSYVVVECKIEYMYFSEGHVQVLTVAAIVSVCDM